MAYRTIREGAGSGTAAVGMEAGPLALGLGGVGTVKSVHTCLCVQNLSRYKCLMRTASTLSVAWRKGDDQGCRYSPPAVAPPCRGKRLALEPAGRLPDGSVTLSESRQLSTSGPPSAT